MSHKKLLKRMKNFCHGAVLWSMIAGVSLPSVVGFSPRVVYAAEKTSTGFYYPTKSDSLGNYAGFLANDCGVSGYGEYHPTDVPSTKHLFHIGKDIAGNVGDSVYAISDGVVEDLQDGDVYGWGHGNVGLVIRHTLADGKTTFLTLDGHVHTKLKIGERVFAGMQTATIGEFSPPHDHWGIVLPGNVMPLHELGRRDCTLWQNGLLPNTNNFIDPVEFIQNHAPQNGHRPGYLGSLIRLKGTEAVYLVSFDGVNIVKRLVNPAAFDANSFDVNDIIDVEQSVMSLLLRGADITSRVTNIPAVQEGQLAHLLPDDKIQIYIVSQGLFHLLAMDGAQAQSLGFDLNNVPALNESYRRLLMGKEISYQVFVSCMATPPPHIAGLGQELTITAHALAKGHYDSDPFIIPFRNAQGLPTFIVGGDVDIASFDLGGRVLWQNADVFGNMEIDSFNLAISFFSSK